MLIALEFRWRLARSVKLDEPGLDLRHQVQEVVTRYAQIVESVASPSVSSVEAVFDGTFPVHYGQAYVLSRPSDVNSDLDDAFVGQHNGLLGASVPGQLWLTTGLHTGRIRLRISKSDAGPRLEDDWQEIVEVSFTPTSSSAALTGWGGEAHPVPLLLDVKSYRVRLCASRMDEAGQQDTLLEDDDPIDEYLLTFWNAPHAPDRIIKQTSSVAAYWHQWAQALPPQ